MLKLTNNLQTYCAGLLTLTLHSYFFDNSFGVFFLYYKIVEFGEGETDMFTKDKFYNTQLGNVF